MDRGVESVGWYSRGEAIIFLYIKISWGKCCMNTYFGCSIMVCYLAVKVVCKWCVIYSYIALRGIVRLIAKEYGCSHVVCSCYVLSPWMHDCIPVCPIVLVT